MKFSDFLTSSQFPTNISFWPASTAFYPTVRHFTPDIEVHAAINDFFTQQWSGITTTIKNLSNAIQNVLGPYR